MENSTEHGLGMKLEHLTFSLLDYVFFSGMLGMSALVGVFFAVFRKQDSTEEYLLGGKKMGVFPVAISLAASYISGIMILGMPSEAYLYGTLYGMSGVSAFMMSVIIGKVYLPVFYRLQLTSSFEYLALRFNNNVRLLASFLCLLGMIIGMPIVMYVPALAFNLVTGLDMKYISPCICLVCIFYTTIGGLRAVVWTDTIQFITMIGATLVIIILGVPNEGGFTKIIEIAMKTDRLEFFDTDFSLYTRETFLSVTVGMAMGWVSSMGVNQMCIQRFLSVPSLSDANKVLYIYCAVVMVMKAICLFSGLIIFARYSGCDPVSAGVISKADQILPYYVLDTTRNVPGLPGLFIAGVFGAALSTLSSFFNTSCGIIYKDFICPFISPNTSEARASNIMKGLVVLLGVSCTAMTIWMDKLSNILQVTISFGGVTSGAMLGIFSMGMLSSRANSKGTMAGAVFSLFLISWMVYGNNRAYANGEIMYPTKSFPAQDCNIVVSGNASAGISHPEVQHNGDEVFFLYRISFMWYSLLGTLVVFVVGLPVSYITSPPSPEQTRMEYFSPVVWRFLPKEITEREERENFEEKGKYQQIDILMQDLAKKKEYQ